MLVGTIISWIVLAIVCGSVAQSIGRTFGNYFILSFCLSPLIGFIVLLIKGRPTEQEKRQILLESKSHIFYCKNCDKTFSGSFTGTEKCPQCNFLTEETVILTDDWRSFSDEKKVQMKKSFANNQFLVSSISMPSPINTESSTISSADELKKYKELLDMGAITQEEYTAKKKQLLGL